MISSPANSSGKQSGGPHQKPQADVYTVLLILALIAVLLAIVCLYFENDMYDWEFKGGPTVSADHRSALARPPVPRPLTPTASTDAPTTLPLLQFRLSG